MTDLSDKIRQLIEAEGVTLKEAITSLVDVQYQLVNPGESQPGVPKPEQPVVTKVEQKRPKSVKYDPFYDPPPPFQSDAPPPRTPPPSQVIAKAGTACVCDACRKVVCVTARDIVANMGADDFLKSFKPMEGMPPVPERMNVKWDDTGMWIDCYACGAELKLRLA